MHEIQPDAKVPEQSSAQPRTATGGIAPVTGGLQQPVLARKRFTAKDTPKMFVDGLAATLARNVGERTEDLATRLLAGTDYGKPKQDVIYNAKQLLPLLDVKFPIAQSAGTAAPRPKRIVSDNTKHHIANGELNAAKEATGMHTISGKVADRKVEPFGDQIAIADDEWGCYRQWVCPTTMPAENRAPDAAKTKKSTFFPDAWTLEDIWNAIAFARDLHKNNLFEVQTEPGMGMDLRYNGISYYPNFRD